MNGATSPDEFPRTWQAHVLPGPPMIAPARSFVLPQAVPGEEDALARGALWIEVTPRTGGTFLLQCALGFAGLGVATGVWATPQPDVLLAIAGGYAYRVDTAQPEQSALLPLRPVVAVHPAPTAHALVLAGFHALYVLGPDEAWQSPRISWEGITINEIAEEAVKGAGWHLPSDRELPFTLNLLTRELWGGAFNS